MCIKYVHEDILEGVRELGVKELKKSLKSKFHMPLINN